MIRELETVVLTKDISEHKLKSGDIGTVVMVHGTNDGYEVEFVNFGGDTCAVLSLTSEEIRPVHQYEMLHVRQVA